MEVRPLIDQLGVYVSGASPDEFGTEALCALLGEHHVVFFAPSDIDDDRQQALLDQMGAGYIHPLGKLMGITATRCSHIVDDADHPPFQDNWHTDVTWDPEPPAIGSLRAIEMPANGGNTIWVNMFEALQTLPDDLRSEIEGKSAIHDMGSAKAFTSKTSPELVAEARLAYPGVERPIIGTHRVTGEPYLNVNSGFTSHIVGMERSESDAMLGRLYDHTHQVSTQYRHEWTVGEFAIWDEQSTQHRAVGDHFPQRREMSRYVVR